MINLDDSIFAKNQLSEQERRRQFLHSFHAVCLPCLDRTQGAFKITCIFLRNFIAVRHTYTILSYGINMTRSVMTLLFVIYKKHIPSDPMAQNNVKNELRGKKSCIPGFWPGPTQTELYSYRKWLET